MFKSKTNDNMCLETLEETCKIYEMENDYSIENPIEQKVCICKRNDVWEVFIQEKGIEFDKTKHKQCIDACLEVIRQCSYSIDEFKDASNEFKTILLSKTSVNKCKIKIK